MFMLKLCRMLMLAIVGAVGAAAMAADVQTSDGIAVAVGGALKLDNDAVWQRLVDLAGGKGARFAVFATAAGNPERSAALIVDALNKRGAVAEAIPVAPRLKGSDARAAARDPAWVARVLAAQGVYFAGGAQERITDTLLDETGRPTPVLDAIWQVYRRGGVVAGSSAGAAIMSTTMFRDAQDVLQVLKLGPQGLRQGKEIDRGLGFVGPAVFVDQHFLKRGRFGRMLPLMVRQGYKLGVGVDENTAAIFRGDTVEVVGYKGALVVDLTDAHSDPALPGFNVRGARLSYLDRGDRYDLKTRHATPSAEKLREPPIDPNAPGFQPYFMRDAFYGDVLADTTVANLMANLIDNAQREVVGLAFGAPTAPAAERPELGFEFRFRKGADSLGYYSGAFGGEDYTVLNILLDVTPVALNLPLYRPLVAATPSGSAGPCVNACAPESAR
jgi:cyanophycinase